MTPTDIVILLLVGLFLIYVIRIVIKQTLQGKCSGCSATKRSPLWLNKYKTDNHCGCGCHDHKNNQKQAS